jgi:hypothetical protein
MKAERRRQKAEYQAGIYVCLTLSLALCLTVESCRKQATATKLIDGLYSYQTMEQARSLTAPRVWQERESSRSPDQTRSRYEVVTVAVQNFVNLDVPGELILSFFNGRLTSTVFYPLDFEKYKANLEKYENIKFEKLEVYRPPRTKVWIGKNAVGLGCVGWEDTALAAEIENWLRR